jgi:HPt (histidine-containing phosphotransfer) domain-containing protein
MSAESEVLHAAIENRWDDVHRLLEDFKTVEVKELGEVCATLEDICTDLRMERASGAR